MIFKPASCKLCSEALQLLLSSVSPSQLLIRYACKYVNLCLPVQWERTLEFKVNEDTSGCMRMILRLLHSWGLRGGNVTEIEREIQLAQPLMVVVKRSPEAKERVDRANILGWKREEPPPEEKERTQEYLLKHRKRFYKLPLRFLSSESSSLPRILAGLLLLRIIRSAEAESSPEVGSSMRRTAGLCTSSMPIETLRFSPPEMPRLDSSPILEPATWSKPSSFNNS
ncbi:hypothetical protein RJ641_017598 [Dillenia turbinata]|uniref:Uncharacterized protein n=1 Tax=Dillenia turbinata TaxID=194707 RepID=A0AAN8UW95_9MAGN